MAEQGTNMHDDRRTVAVRRAEVLKSVQEYLGITWHEEQSRVILWVDAGITYLDKIRSAPANYSEAGLPKTLLLEFCRYMRDSALDVFENNYRGMLMQMRNERIVKSYVEKTFPSEK